jgi:hypothetical protein
MMTTKNFMTANSTGYSLLHRASVVLWGVLLIFCPPACAVSLSASGLGQVLIYPYYTVRVSPGGAYNTLFELTNTSADSKVVRVRFRESRNGREVAGANVFLVPFDTWTGVVVPGTGGPQFRTADQSCTEPLLAFPSQPTGALPFSNAQYSGANADGEDPSIDRSSEGYIEVIDEGVIKNTVLLDALQTDRSAGGGVIPDCVAARAVALDNVTALGPPSGGLMGSAFIIDVLGGTLYSYDATALNAFSNVPLWSAASNTSLPTLADVTPKTSAVFTDAGVVLSSWDTAKGALPVDPVSAVLMRDSLLNTFVLEPSTRSGTDWVVTMPTKPFYVNTAPQVAAVRAPFETAFSRGGAPAYFGTFGSPPDSGVGNTQIYDREGGFCGPNRCGTFAAAAPATVLQLPWTAGIVTFNNTNLFGAAATISVPIDSASGWLRLSPYPYANSGVHRLVSTDSPPTTYLGLPMIGFMANNYINGTLQGNAGPVLSNYGATSPHKGSISIQ